jgi:hypothetical protein
VHPTNDLNIDEYDDDDNLEMPTTTIEYRGQQDLQFHKNLEFGSKPKQQPRDDGSLPLFYCIRDLTL